MNILFATGNEHKIKEANNIGEKYGVTFEKLEIKYPEVRSDSVEEVASEGAKYVFQKVGKPVIVEDSGLFIATLNGFPGAYSAMIYKKIGVAGVLKILENTTERQAHFASAIGYTDAEHQKIFSGIVEGTITDSPRGTHGFAYDPIFTPTGCEKTFGEDEEIKNKISHRKTSVEKFCQWITENK